MIPISRRKEAYSTRQLYDIAVTARDKLSTAASEAEHNLRQLVGHANLLDDLTEALLVHKIDTDDSKVDKWSDTLLGLDEDSDGSSCGDDSEFEDLYERTSSDLEDHKGNPRDQNDHADPVTMVIRPTPRRPAPLLQIVDAMPKLERMKHCPTLDSIVEEDVAYVVQGTLQAMEAIPVALQAMQALTISTEDGAASDKDFGSPTLMMRSTIDVDAPLAASATSVGAT